MVESIVSQITEWLSESLSGDWVAFIVSLFPILELRGGMIAASLLGLDLIPSFIICYIGNMIPVPFILLFIRKIFQFLRDKPFFGKVIQKLEIRSMRKSDTVKKYGKWGLLAFVAIPLPGTGGWTGALIAALLDMRIKTSTFVIAVGVFIAGVIMSVVSYGIPALISML